MENLMTAEVQLMIYAFLGVLVANAVRWVYRWVSNYVAETPNKIDDKIWRAVTEAIEGATNEGLSDWEDELFDQESALAFREDAVEKQKQGVKLLRDDLAKREKALAAKEELVVPKNLNITG